MNRASFFKRFLLLGPAAVFSFWVSSTAAFLPQAESADGASLKVGFVNISKVFGEYEGTKSTDSKFGELSKNKRSEREEMVSEIKSMREELILLNEESRAEKQKAIEERIRQLGEFDRETRESLRRQWDDATKKIFEEIEETVTAYAKDHGFSLILTNRDILYGEGALDVTQDVLSLLNERYKGKRS